jgi:hypothetical protein
MRLNSHFHIRHNLLNKLLTTDSYTTAPCR